MPKLDFAEQTPHAMDQNELASDNAFATSMVYQACEHCTGNWVLQARIYSNIVSPAASLL